MALYNPPLDDDSVPRPEGVTNVPDQAEIWKQQNVPFQFIANNPDIAQSAQQRGYGEQFPIVESKLDRGAPNAREANAGLVPPGGRPDPTQLSIVDAWGKFRGEMVQRGLLKDMPQEPDLQAVKEQAIADASRKYSAFFAQKGVFDIYDATKVNQKWLAAQLQAAANDAAKMATYKYTAEKAQHAETEKQAYEIFGKNYVEMGKQRHEQSMEAARAKQFQATQQHQQDVLWKDKNYLVDRLVNGTPEEQSRARNTLSAMDKQEVGLTEKKKRAEQDVLGEDAFGSWSPQAKEMAYRDRVVGLGSKYSFTDKQSWRQFNEGYQEWRAANNITESDVKIIQSKYKSLDSAMLKAQSNLTAAGIIVNTIQQQSQELMRIYKNDLTRSQNEWIPRLINLPRRALAIKAQGSGDEAKAAALLMEISTETAKLSTGSQASIKEPGAEYAKRWLEIHDPNMSVADMKKVIDLTNSMATMRMKAGEQAISSLQNEMDGLFDRWTNRKKGTPAPGTPPPAGTKTQKIGKYIVERID